MKASGLAVRNLTKRFGTDTSTAPAVADVSFDVAAGEFFTMLGPSGCGKTTTLRMIAGLEAASAGEIVMDGRDYRAVPARQRNVGMVFQSYALFPHLSVFENVAYGLRVRGVAASEIGARVGETLRLLALETLAGRRPADLSGGQQQRVSLARALVYRPAMLLLDEPLANLDAKLRVQMREEIRRVQRALGITVLYVTHDQEEAMAVSDRIAVFNQGRLMQVAPPAEIYAAPASLFVADFIGKSNFFPVSLGAGNQVRLGEVAPFTPGRHVVVPASEREQIPANAAGLLMVKPESCEPAGATSMLRATIARAQTLGAVTRYELAVPGLAQPVLVDRLRPVVGWQEGAACGFGFAAEDATLFLRDAVI